MGTAEAGADRDVAVFASLAVALSIAQMLQYWAGILPCSDVTCDQYREFFLRLTR